MLSRSHGFQVLLWLLVWSPRLGYQGPGSVSPLLPSFLCSRPISGDTRGGILGEKHGSEGLLQSPPPTQSEPEGVSGSWGPVGGKGRQRVY